MPKRKNPYPSPPRSVRRRLQFTPVRGMAAVADAVYPGAGRFVRGAHGAARIIQKAYRRYAMRKKTYSAATRRSRMGGQKGRVAHGSVGNRGKYFGSIGYAGKIGRAKKKYMYTKDLPYKKYGALYHQQISGTVADPDCAYLTHSSTSVATSIKMVAQAMVRKLLKKYQGFDCQDANQEIMGADYNAANGLSVALITVNESDGSLDTVVYNLVNNDTLASVASQFEERLQFISSGVNPAVANPTTQIWKAQRLILYETGVKAIGELNLLREKIHYWSESEMKIQNASQSTDGSSSTDVVNSVPVNGIKIVMKGAVPQTGTYIASFNAIDRTTGVRLLRAAELGTGSVYQEPINAKYFVNAKGQTNIRMNPGQLKNDKVYYKTTSYFNAFLKRLRSQHINSQTNWTIGNCALYSFNKTITLDTAYKVTIMYEVTRKTGVFLTTGPTVPLKGQFVKTTYNNNPA